VSTPVPTRGPRRGDIVSAAAGRLGMAARYGAPEEQLATLRQALEAAKLEKRILEVAPGLAPAQIRRLGRVLRNAAQSGS
jgi:predicted RNase H-like nuclease